MARRTCGAKKMMMKGLWSPEEDGKLINHIAKYGHGCWSWVPKGLERCGKSCRLRWMNYLRPDLKRGALSQEEEDRIVRLHSILGNKWSQIASQLPGPTDNEIKNFWNSDIKKKLRHRGVDSAHMPLAEANRMVPVFISDAELILPSTGQLYTPQLVTAESYAYSRSSSTVNLAAGCLNPDTLQGSPSSSVPAVVPSVSTLLNSMAAGMKVAAICGGQRNDSTSNQGFESTTTQSCSSAGTNHLPCLELDKLKRSDDYVFDGYAADVEQYIYDGDSKQDAAADGLINSWFLNCCGSTRGGE